MIPQTECPPIFYYGYSPSVDEFRMDPADGGFNVTLYEDCRLVFTMVDTHGESRRQLVYDLPTPIRDEYRGFVEKNQEAIRSIPRALQMPEGRTPRFTSSIGLVGCDFLTCQDIPQMCHLPFGVPEGRYSRRLCSLMEDLAEVLLPFGLHFSLYGFETDDQLLQPINGNAADDTVWGTAAAS